MFPNIKRYAMRNINLKSMAQQTDSFEFKDENARFGIKDEWMNKPLHIGGQKQQTAVEWLIEQLVELDKQLDGRRKSDDSTVIKLNPTRIFEQAKRMEKEQMKSQTSIDLLRDKAERAWTPCHGCDDNDKNFWINGYIHGALEN